MKVSRSLFRWPLVSAGVTLLLWLALCFVVIGIPASGRAYGRGDYWSPAAYVLGVDACEEVARWLQVTVNVFWDSVPYCRIRVDDRAWGLQTSDSAALRVYVGRSSSSAPQQNRSLVQVWAMPKNPAPVPWGARSQLVLLYPSLPSARQVVVYVGLLPGVHFAAVVFVVMLMVGSIVRVVSCVVSPSAKEPTGSGEES